MKTLLSILLIFSLHMAFAQKSSRIIFPPPVLGMEYPDFMEACDLPAHKNQLVYTRLIYSGVDEYWGVRPEKKCNKINAYLDIPDSVEVKAEDTKNIKYVHDHYWKKYLIIVIPGDMGILVQIIRGLL
jgi:hypothetical protein